MLENRPAAIPTLVGPERPGRERRAAERRSARGGAGLSGRGTAASAWRSARNRISDGYSDAADRRERSILPLRLMATEVACRPCPTPTRRYPTQPRNVPCSTRPARPASRKAACCPMTISCAAGAGTPRSVGYARCALGEDRLITPLPMTHVNAMAYSTLAMVLTGGCIIPLDRFHPRSWWQTCAKPKQRSCTASA